MPNNGDFTVIIPAHNEEAVIARALRGIVDGIDPEALPQIIVAANGCSDQTVARAKGAAPTAIVLEMEEGSKTGAINKAMEISTRAPCIVMDADVECGYSTLAAIAETLRKPGIKIASPQRKLNLTKCNFWTRAYYRVWQEQPYAKQGKGGSGCYGLSAEALLEIGQFPEIIADDLWVHSRFPDNARAIVERDLSGDEAFSLVHPPRTAWEQIRVEARRQIGNAQVRRLFPRPYPNEQKSFDGARTALTGGSAVKDLAIYSAMKLAARLLARFRTLTGRDQVWSRDTGSREA